MFRKLSEPYRRTKTQDVAIFAACVVAYLVGAKFARTVIR